MPHFRLIALSCAILMSTAFSGWAQTAPPNILWIIGDDWGAHASAYGTAAVDTPNIDQLASEGLKFTNVYTTAPVCSAMRSALITGMYQTSIGAHHHRTRTKSPLPAGVDVITAYFRDAGYYTSNGNANQDGNGKLDYNFQGSFGSIFDGNDWRDRPANTPFFSQVQIFDPHRGFIGANTDANRPAKLDLPQYYPNHELARKDYADYLADVETFDTKVGNVLARLEADGLADNTIVMVFGDHGAPHVRDKQWLYDGGIRIPLIIRDPTGTVVPTGQQGSSDSRMISHIDIAATSLALAGAKIPDHLQGEDFSPPGNTGRDAIYAAKDRLDGVVDRVRSVQVGNMKLIRNFDPGTPYMLGLTKESAYKHRQYPVHTLMKVMHGRGLLTPEQAQFLTENRPEYELYDLSTDPNELVNLAENPAYATSLEGLRRKLDLWMLQTDDMGGDFDPDAASELNSMRNTYKNTLSSRVTLDATDYEYLEWWANEYNVALNLPQTAPDLGRVRLPNRSWDNTDLNNGAWNTDTPQGWSDAFSVVVQNMTALQMAQESHDGANVLILNSDGGRVRWAMDDNWGNLVEFEEMLGWEIELEVWVGRRSDKQGVDPGTLEISLQNTASDRVLTEVFDLDGTVAQGSWEQRIFTLRVTDDVVGAAGPQEQLYLALGNIAEGLSDNKMGRVLIDDLQLTIRPFVSGDVDGDSDVDGTDFLQWQRGASVNPLSQTDLVDWHLNYGDDGNALATSTLLPEPRPALLIGVGGFVAGANQLRRR